MCFSLRKPEPAVLLHGKLHNVHVYASIKDLDDKHLNNSVVGDLFIQTNKQINKHFITDKSGEFYYINIKLKLCKNSENFPRKDIFDKNKHINLCIMYVQVTLQVENKKKTIVYFLLGDEFFFFCTDFLQN